MEAIFAKKPWAVAGDIVPPDVAKPPMNGEDGIGRNGLAGVAFWSSFRKRDLRAKKSGP